MAKQLCIGCMRIVPPGEQVCPVCGQRHGVDSGEAYTLRPGTVLNQIYLVGRVIGQGGFGITYIGFDMMLQRKVAIKEYFPMATGMVTRDGRSTVVWSQRVMSNGDRQRGFESFVKEARKMAKLEQIPGVVGVRGVFQQNETAYIVMDFIEGETLKKRLEKTGPMPFDVCVKLLTPVIQAMERVHHSYIIHRDISPDNIMLDGSGNVYLLDLGAAKDLSIQHANGTVSSQLVAKHGFSPPEQYMEHGSIGSWTDVYAMSATIYYCVTGKLPPKSNDRTFEDTFAIQPPLTQEQFDILSRGMALRYQNRIQTMDELLRALQPVIPDQEEENRRLEEERRRQEEAEWRRQAEAERLQREEAERHRAEEEARHAEELRRMEAELRRAQEEKRRMEEQLRSSQTAPQKSISEEIIISEKPQKHYLPAVIAAILVAVCSLVFAFPRDSGKPEAEVSDVTEPSTAVTTETMVPFIAATTAPSITETTAPPTTETTAPPTQPIAVNVMRRAETYDELKAMGFDSTDSRQNAPFWGQDKFTRAEVQRVVFLNSLSQAPSNAFDVSADGNRSVLAWMKSGTLYVGSDGRVILNEDSSYLFYFFTNLETIDFGGNIDTGNVTNMYSMFCVCWKLTSLDVSGFETSKVTDMSSMFSCCERLTSLDLSGFDTSQVTDMGFMFYHCESLTSLDLSGFDTSRVTLMGSMFSSCLSLTTLKLGKLNTSNVTNMYQMFYGCSSLTSLDLSSFDTREVTDMSGMFNGCSSLTALDLSRFDTRKVTDMCYMFNGCSSLTSLDLSRFDTRKVTNMSMMFDGCSSLTSLDLSSFDTSNVTNMRFMFTRCSRLTSLNLSSFDTSQVTDMRQMFYGCSSLTSLDLSGFDTSKVTDMWGMFRDCSKLKTMICNDSAVQQAYNRR